MAVYDPVLIDGEACGHRACLSHKTYPCPFCGRIAGRALTHSERIAQIVMKEFDSGEMRSSEEWFQRFVELITPIVNGPSIRRVVYAEAPSMMIDTEGEAKRLAAFLATEADLRFEIPKTEPRPWLQMPWEPYEPWYLESLGTIRRLPKAIWAVLKALRHGVIDVLYGWREDCMAFDQQIKSVVGIPKTLLGLPVYTASSCRAAQEKRDHDWKTVYGPRLREWQGHRGREPESNERI